MLCSKAADLVFAEDGVGVVVKLIVEGVGGDGDFVDGVG